MINNGSISIRLESLGARLRTPDHLKFNSRQEQRFLSLVAELEALLDEVEEAA